MMNLRMDTDRLRIRILILVFLKTKFIFFKNIFFQGCYEGQNWFTVFWTLKYGTQSLQIRIRTETNRRLGKFRIYNTVNPEFSDPDLQTPQLLKHTFPVISGSNTVPDPWHFSTDPFWDLRSGSLPLNGSGSCSFHQWPLRCQKMFSLLFMLDVGRDPGGNLDLL